MWNGEHEQPSYPPADDDASEGETMHWERNDDPPPLPKPRGKPEAMAQRLAAARVQANLEELEAERREAAASESKVETATAEIISKPPPPPPPPPKNVGKPNVNPEGGVLVQATTLVKPPKKKKVTKPRKKPQLPISKKRKTVHLIETAKPITEAEYENLEALMKQFCRVPLLAEFSRPISLLHPELMAAYSKIVSRPIDLGHVCRGIRRRLYKNTRDIRLDMWRVFANCVKFHSHPHNKEAVPSFVSIALHLREFFNNLLQEYMLPSDVHDPTIHQKRHEERKKNLENSGVLVLTERIIQKTAKLLKEFVENGGRTDRLDADAIFPNPEEPDMAVVVQNLLAFAERLPTLEEYTVDSFHHDLKDCYTKDVLEDSPALRHKVANRLSRLFWKLLIPLHEANSRGVTQSSIWGNLAATIWARESSKKPFWPALCLGILPPADQREGWHDAVTKRNEARLPEKLRLPLETAKKKCLAAQKRQSLSYFLVEFLGTHEFIWVRETDIVENFDPENDPNKKMTNKKMKRSSRSGLANVVGSRNYATALEECVWANEEYENVLQDAFAYASDTEGGGNEDDDDEEMNYSYSLLSQSDDEADDVDNQGYGYKEAEMAVSDIDEFNWLLTHSGMLDTSATGRKNAKKRTQALKKKATTESKADKKRRESKGGKSKDVKARDRKGKESRASQTKAKDKEREEKKEIRELEKRRRKRMREREKVLRIESRKQKRQRKPEEEEDERGLVHNKRARATAIVRAYLTRMTKEEDYKSLALGGVLAMPAAMVDSTGLLGKALAFRAAAGEIPMPDDGEEQVAKIKPWLAVDTLKAKVSSDRAEALKRQAALLEKHIEVVRANTQRRKEWAEAALAEREKIEKQIKADDEAARRNHFKKKKKYVKAPSEVKTSSEADANSGAKPAEEVVIEADDADNEDDEVVVEAESVDGDDDDGLEIDASSVHAEPMEVE